MMADFLASKLIIQSANFCAIFDDVLVIDFFANIRFQAYVFALCMVSVGFCVHLVIASQMASRFSSKYSSGSHLLAHL